MLSRIALKLFSTPIAYKTVKITAISSFKLSRVQYFSSNVKEAIYPDKKIIDSIKLEPEIKINKRNEILCEDLVNLIEDEKILLVDVREKEDIEKSGIIPSAIHIPLNKLKSSLQLSSAEFKDAFGVDKPDIQSENLIFYGMKELKGTSACELAYSLGFKKSRSFSGGFKEWSEKGLKIIKINVADKASE